MGEYVANEVVKNMILKNMSMNTANILILGVTFKENCPDITNSKAFDVYKCLLEYNFNIDVYDPWANAESVKEEYKIELIESINSKYDVILHVVAHSEFMNLDYDKIRKPISLVYDVKGVLPKKTVDKRL